MLYHVVSFNSLYCEENFSCTQRHFVVFSRTSSECSTASVWTHSEVLEDCQPRAGLSATL